jgi:hypothetical protein
MRYLNSKSYLKSNTKGISLYIELLRLANNKFSDLRKNEGVWKRMVQLDAIRQIRMV